MKTILLTLSAVFTASLAFSQKKGGGYQIEGNIKGLDTGKIYFAHFARDRKMDSTQIVKGKFRFSGKLDNPMPVIIWTAPLGYGKNTLFFAENSNIRITIDTANTREAVITGPASQKDFAAFTNALKPYDTQIEKLYQLRTASKGNQARIDSIGKVWEGVSEEKKLAAKKFIQENPRSIVAAYGITRHFMTQPDVDELEALYNGLAPVIQQTSIGKDVATTLNKEKATGIGRMAPEFTQNDTLGNPVSLRSFRGQYVLVDFWASWCGPCRAENPNVVKAFNKYKHKNFTVLGVSLDNPGKKQAWLDAIHKDGLTWPHVSDLKGWENEASNLYGVSAIPSNFLIDPQGKIIGKNIRGEKLEEILSGLFN